MSESPASAMAKQAVRIRCALCRHAWIAAYIPMLLATFARVLRDAHCPMCGASAKDLRWLGAAPTRRRKP